MGGFSWVVFILSPLFVSRLFLIVMTASLHCLVGWHKATIGGQFSPTLSENTLYTAHLFTVLFRLCNTSCRPP